MRSFPRWRSATADRRGAVLVEAALTAPLFFFLVFAIIEYGLMFRDNLTLASTTRDAARAASVLGSDANADHEVLAVVTTASSAMPRGNIQRIVLFKASSVDAQVPAACLTASVADTCNSYTPAHLDEPASAFGCASGSPDRFWCPAGRVVAQSAANGGPPDLLGVHIEIERPRVSGFFPGTQRLRDTFILRLEPTDV